MQYPGDQCDYIDVVPRKLHAKTQSGDLKIHKEIKLEGVWYPCDPCGNVSLQSGDLKKHKETKHEGVQYLCDHCDFFATQSDHLEMHKEIKHFNLEI